MGNDFNDEHIRLHTMLPILWGDDQTEILERKKTTLNYYFAVGFKYMETHCSGFQYFNS